MAASNLAEFCRVAKLEPSVASLCRELDSLELVANERGGGPNEADLSRIEALEASIGRLPADSPDVVLWRMRRLARAALNGWRSDFVEPLAAALERDMLAIIK